MLCIKTFLLKQAFSWVPKFILGHSSLRKWNRENVRIILILILEKSRARGPLTYLCHRASRYQR